MQHAIRSAFRNHITSVASLAVIIGAIVVGRAAGRCADSVSTAERNNDRVAAYLNSRPSLAPFAMMAPCSLGVTTLP